MIYEYFFVYLRKYLLKKYPRGGGQYFLKYELKYSNRREQIA